jgi:6-phosphogluconolactonase
MIERTTTWHEFSTREVFSEKLTDLLGKTLQFSSITQERVLFGVSGGSTPLPIYRQLAARELAWNKIHMVIVDERWVPTDHPDSNEKNIRHAFSEGVIESPKIIGLWSEQDNLDMAATAANQTLAALNSDLDVILLGMGEDGHFASLFPTAAEFSTAISKENTRLVFPIEPMPAHAAHSRLSMSLAYIQRAKRIVLAITGEKKRTILQQAIAHGDVNALPIAALFTANSPAVDIYWSE